MEPYYADESVTLYHGDALQMLREMPDGSVDCCVTSPPYFGLRDYGVEGQYGLESSPAEFVETMRALFSEVRRVLADDGTLWLNLGDSYSTHQGKPGKWRAGEYLTAGKGKVAPARNRNGTAGDVPAKNLLGIPWRVAFALQDDGWTLRNAIVWHKPNAMPESVTDRLSNRYEPLFLFSKSRRYWFDLDPIREAPLHPEIAHVNRSRPDRGFVGQADVMRAGHHEQGRNPGDVWSIPTQPFAEAHFAVMPQALAERAILAGCKPGGTVLDPFSGSGTTGLVATKHGRRYVGIDLSADYLDLSLRTRLAQGVLDFGDGGAA
jgi:site-specific DNA-methyltransferase (cytosine-N4-specific)